KDPASGLTGPLNLRCTGTPGTNNNTCDGWDPGQGQLDPAGAYSTGYQDPTTSYQALSNGTIETLRETAQAQGTYYSNSCPPFGATGVLFVETAPVGGCSYAGTGGVPWGSDSAPVALVIANGTLTFGANVSYYGVIYMADEQETTLPPSGSNCTSSGLQSTVFTVQGGGAIHGGVFVDK